MSLFPERINGKLWAILSVNTDRRPTKICLANFAAESELWSETKWDEWYKNFATHALPLERRPDDHIEAGAPPLKTPAGWLVFYSYIQNYFGGGRERVFGIEAVLLDMNDPHKILGRTRGPLLVPRESYEVLGHVADVVFPSGAVLERDTLLIYYGAADTTICLAHVNMTDLLGTMRPETEDDWCFKRFDKNPIITANALHPWEAKATFNPAAIRLNNTTHILYRTFSNDNTSYIGYASSKDGLTIDERLPEPIYGPREDFESKKVADGNSGCEDPRLTKIGNTLYMCYTAFDSIGPPRVAITSILEKDFLAKNWKWEKPILITPPTFDDKDTCIFPEKTQGQYFILHRVGNEICGDYFKELDFTKQKVTKCIRIIGPRINSWDSSKVGIAAPPLKTKHGWLLLYHGVSNTHNTYRVGALLLDLKDPAIVLARTTDPIFEPKEKYEKEGIIHNVVFPCGMAVKSDTLYIYYGGADTVTGVATMKLKIILDALTRDVKLARKEKNKKEKTKRVRRRMQK